MNVRGDFLKFPHNTKIDFFVFSATVETQFVMSTFIVAGLV